MYVRIHGYCSFVLVYYFFETVRAYELVMEV